MKYTYSITFAAEIIKTFFVMIFTGLCAYDDLKSRSISAEKCIFFAFIGAAVILAELLSGKAYENMLFELVLSMLTGGLLCLMSYFSGGAIGIGDGVFLLVCGLYMKPQEVMLLSASAWLLCSAAAFIIILCSCFKPSKRKYRLPYITFVFPIMAAEKIYMLIMR